MQVSHNNTVSKSIKRFSQEAGRGSLWILYDVKLNRAIHFVSSNKYWKFSSNVKYSLSIYTYIYDPF